MSSIDNYQQAWKKGFIDGCIEVNDTYTGVPPIPILKVKAGENPLEVYYKDGLKEGKKYALQTLAGNYKYKRD